MRLMKALAAAVVLGLSPGLAAAQPASQASVKAPAAPPSAVPAVGPHVDDPSPPPQPPPTIAGMAYDSRVLASAASAEHFQGPLDGGWTLHAKHGGDLYGLEFTDKRTALDGAWRDLKKARGAQGSGVIDQLQRTDAGLTARFDGAVLALGPDLRGRLTRGARSWKVALRKTTP
jgi:hypothetical protein